MKKGSLGFLVLFGSIMLASVSAEVRAQGGTEIDLAVEKNEVVRRAHSIAAHFGREPFDTWHKNGFDRYIVQTARKKDSRASDAPTVNELFEQHKVPDDSRRVAQIILAWGILVGR